MAKPKITGSFVALITPFNKDGTVDFPAFRELLAFQERHGTAAVLIMGSTGETSMLSPQEKERLAQAEGKWPEFPRTLVELADKHPPALPGVLGHKSIAMTQRYAHLSPAHRRSMVDRMEQIWAKPAVVRPTAANSPRLNGPHHSAIKRVAVARTA